MCQGYGHIALDCPNRKSIIMINREIHDIFEEEKEDIPESFEEETMGEPIFDEKYVDFHDAFEEMEKEDPIYHEYGLDDNHQVFKKDKEKDEPIYAEEYVPTEYGESLEVEKSLQITTSKEELWLGHNILHTHCTSQEMVCIVMIDNKRCETLHQTIQ